MLWGLPLGIVLLGVAVLRSGLFGRWKALPLAVGLLMSPLLNLLLFLPLYLVTGSDILVPTDWPDFAFFVVPNAIVGTSWVLLGWVLRSGRGERLSSGVERASLYQRERPRGLKEMMRRVSNLREGVLQHAGPFLLLITIGDRRPARTH
jgi:hypothetical protein